LNQNDQENVSRENSLASSSAISLATVASVHRDMIMFPNMIYHHATGGSGGGGGVGGGDRAANEIPKSVATSGCNISLLNTLYQAPYVISQEGVRPKQVPNSTSELRASIASMMPAMICMQACSSPYLNSNSVEMFAAALAALNARNSTKFVGFGASNTAMNSNECFPISNHAPVVPQSSKSASSSLVVHAPLAAANYYGLYLNSLSESHQQQHQSQQQRPTTTMTNSNLFYDKVSL
jgi:hypothetical protein